jgi:hypothetical protein
MDKEMESSLQQTMVRFLADMKVVREELKAHLKAMVAVRMAANQAEMLANQADMEATEAAVEQQHLFDKETNFNNIRTSEDRCGDRRLVVRRRGGAKKRSQESVASQQKSFAARKRLLRHAVPAVRKGQMQKGPGKDRTARGTPKGRRLEKECNIGLRNREPKNQLRLWMKRISDIIIRKLSELTSLFNLLIATREINENAFWKVRHRSSARRICGQRMDRKH